MTGAYLSSPQRIPDKGPVYPHSPDTPEPFSTRITICHSHALAFSISLPGGLYRQALVAYHGPES